jgi:hypothetical protein
VGFGSSDWPATTWVVLQVAYFVTDQALPCYHLKERAELDAAFYKRNQHSAKLQAPTELYTFTYIS